MTREQKVQFIVDSIYQIEGALVPPAEFEEMTEDELSKEVEWYEYLWTK